MHVAHQFPVYALIQGERFSKWKRQRQRTATNQAPAITDGISY